jgi:ABC-type transport system substrate-binding protein
MHGIRVRVPVLGLIALVGLWAAPMALASEQPRSGGILQVALAGDPPSLDMHQKQTFMVAQPLGPVYNNLIMFDPHNYPEIVGDLATSWTVSNDHLTYTFTLHKGMTFHDSTIYLAFTSVAFLFSTGSGARLACKVCSLPQAVPMRSSWRSLSPSAGNVCASCVITGGGSTIAL